MPTIASGSPADVPRERNRMADGHHAVSLEDGELEVGERRVERRPVLSVPQLVTLPEEARPTGVGEALELVLEVGPLGERQRLERHQYGSVSRPISSRATISFITSAVPSPISSPMTSRSRCSNGSSSV